MAIDSDIRDQAYLFFIQEAPELLQVIETDLLTLREERSTAKVHNMMRAAHSIKGGAASVGLETIKTLAHSLEDIFKGLHNEELEIDAEVESLLLQAYDCLRLPLMEQISTGQFNSDKALEMAEPVFAQIEAQLGHFLKQAADLPSSIELGVDIALSIFEVDIAQGLERLTAVLADPQAEEIAGELRAQAEVFAGIAELLNLPGFGAIAQTALAAIDAHPEQALPITQMALADFQAGREAVLAGDRTQGGSPSSDYLISIPNRDLHKTTIPNIDIAAHSTTQCVVDAQENRYNILPRDSQQNSELVSAHTVYDTDAPDFIIATAGEEVTALPSIDDVFGGFVLSVEPAVTPTTAPLQKLRPDAVETVDDQDNILEPIQQIFDAELVEQESAIVDDAPAAIPSLDDVFGNFVLSIEPAALGNSLLTPVTPITAPPQKLHPNRVKAVNTQDSIQELVQSVEQAFDSLPEIDNSAAIVPAPVNLPTVAQNAAISTPANLPATQQLPTGIAVPTPAAPTPHLSVRVDLERLERMNNVVGELAINRNGLSLQNEQLQGAVQELLRQFAKFQEMGYRLRDLSDQMLVAPDHYGSWTKQQRSRGAEGQGSRGTLERWSSCAVEQGRDINNKLSSAPLPAFDSLEMDSYGKLHSLLQDTLEEMVQLEETVGDVVLFAGQSSQTIEQQRQMLGHLRDDLMWARMLPLGEVLNRFPRMLRDLSKSYDKPVDLKLSGTGVLVDKAALEKLHDPLMHLLRNAFDHGIEMPEVRCQQGKHSQAKIEVRAYHQGSQTIIEVRDDGRGLNLERIRNRALEMGLISAEQLATASTSSLLEVLFQPGFSTASQVSELSGRGVGLDVVRSQLRSLKGTVTVNSEPGQGTTFTLRIPLTLTIAKLLVCFVGSTAFALPSDSIAEILIPQSGQVKQSGGQRFLHWQDRIVPAYHLSELLNYARPLPEVVPSDALIAVPSPDDWASPMLLLSQNDQILALEIDRLVTEQELVIKPLGAAIAPPSYIYGCTILGDGSLVPVIDGAALLNSFTDQPKTVTFAATKANLPASTLNEQSSISSITTVPFQTTKIPTLLVVDDSITLRQTLTLTFEKAGYRVLQARDGREAIDRLQQNSTIQLVVCDVEMPNMNGFEFLSHRRQDPLISKIPTVMLTSRSSDKHRQFAMHLGASAYFTKPYIEQEFLAAIKAIITT